MKRILLFVPTFLPLPGVIQLSAATLARDHERRLSNPADQIHRLPSRRLVTDNQRLP